MVNWPWLLQWRWGSRTTRLHWSLPIGAAVAGLAYQSADAVIAYLLILVAHMAGHLWLARRRGLSVVEVSINGLGGSVRVAGKVSPLGLVWVGSGGVLGQLLLWLTVSLLALSLDWSTDNSVLYSGLTRMNLGLVLLNLLPIDGSDGPSVWAMPGTLARRLTDRLTYMQMQELQAQRQHWQTIIDAAQARDTLRPLRPRAKSEAPGATTQTIEQLRAQVEADLTERDARADAGIPTETVSLANTLLADVWGSASEEE